MLIELLRSLFTPVEEPPVETAPGSIFDDYPETGAIVARLNETERAEASRPKWHRRREGRLIEINMEAL